VVVVFALTNKTCLDILTLLPPLESDAGMTADEIKIITLTEGLMRDLRIPVRDTWHGLAGKNLDDWFSNGCRYDGPRLFSISADNSVPTAQQSANRRYNVLPCLSLAYDAVHIRYPQRLSNRRDEILVHETAHFLQHNSAQEEKNYISFNGQNFLYYMAQRVEIEAHLVQLFYLTQYNIERLRSFGYVADTFAAEIKNVIARGKMAPLNFILQAKTRELI